MRLSQRSNRLTITTIYGGVRHLREKNPKTFHKDLFKLSEKDRQKVISIIEKQLANNPHSGKKLKGVPHGVWRIRIGNYRIRYDIVSNDVVFHRIRHRKDVYRK